MYQTRGKEDDIKLAEQYYKAVTALNGKDINGHFYLGLFYEKNNKKSEAKAEYNKVIGLLAEGKNNEETVEQIERMIANVDRGISNTPESLGLIQENSEQPELNAEPESQPANAEIPTIEETQGE